MAERQHHTDRIASPNLFLQKIAKSHGLASEGIENTSPFSPPPATISTPIHDALVRYHQALAQRRKSGGFK